MAWYADKLIAPSGGDYTKLSDFESAYDGEDISGTDGVRARLRGTDGTTSTNVYWGGWQAGQSTSCKIVVQADSGYETDGNDGDGTTNARHPKNVNIIETTNDIYMDVSGLEFYISAILGTVNHTIRQLRVTKCLFRDNPGTASYAVSFNTTPAQTCSILVGGCLVKDFTGTYGSGVCVANQANYTVTVINCTIVRMKYKGVNISGTNPTATVKNTVVASATGTDFTNVDTEVTNKSIDDSEVTLDDSDDFTAPSTDDFTVYNASSSLYHAGTAIADSWFTELCATDLAGTTWNNPPSVGAYEYVGGESSSPLPSLYSISARSGSCTAKSGLGSIDNIGVNDYKKYEM